jgi:hypothetical protein
LLNSRIKVFALAAIISSPAAKLDAALEALIDAKLKSEVLKVLES